jgi:hypothetical protein
MTTTRVLLLSLAASLPAFAAPEPTVTSPASGASTPATLTVHVGGQVGFPFLLGATARANFLSGDRARFAVDATWEPSALLQSYSVGGAWHVLDSVFFVGGRLRLVQYQPPWARGSAAPFFGAGLEAGLRFRVGSGGALSVTAHGSYVPGQATNLAALVGLSVGFSWEVYRR